MCGPAIVAVTTLVWNVSCRHIAMGAWRSGVYIVFRPSPQKNKKSNEHHFSSCHFTICIVTWTDLPTHLFLGPQNSLTLKVVAGCIVTWYRAVKSWPLNCHIFTAAWSIAIGMGIHTSDVQNSILKIVFYFDKKLRYCRETARQLRTYT